QIVGPITEIRSDAKIMVFIMVEIEVSVIESRLINPIDQALLLPQPASSPITTPFQILWSRATPFADQVGMVAQQRFIPLLGAVSDGEDKFGTWQGMVKHLIGEIQGERDVLKSFRRLTKLEDAPEVTASPVLQQQFTPALIPHLETQKP